jgi:hypothetical protein
VPIKEKKYTLKENHDGLFSESSNQSQDDFNK